MSRLLEGRQLLSSWLAFCGRLPYLVVEVAELHATRLVLDE
jgi:hypothetical protein